MSGNTKLVAENIKEGIMESGHECEIFEMRDISENFDFENCDLLGFMSPVYAWKEPTIFNKFLRNLPQLNGKFAFISATAGSDFGNYFFSVHKILEKKGIKTIAICAICAPSSFTVWNTDEYDYEFEEEEIQKAFTFGTNIFNEYNEIVVKGIKKIPEIKRENLKILLSLFGAHDFSLSFIMGKLHIDESLCTKCGICANSCAWNAILFEKGEIPKINMKKCGGCCACINLCPKEAIWNKKTVGKIKYHEPSYKGYKSIS